MKSIKIQEALKKQGLRLTKGYEVEKRGRKEKPKAKKKSKKK